jgi:hypothetical protein
VISAFSRWLQMRAEQAAYWAAEPLVQRAIDCRFDHLIGGGSIKALPAFKVNRREFEILSRAGFGEKIAGLNVEVA